jgi:hypothetical protein
MENIKVAAEILKIAKALTAGSLDGMSTLKAKKIINKTMEPHTKGMFRDEYWKPVHDIFKAFESAGIDYVLSSAKYENDSRGNPSSKRWSLEFHFTNDKGKETVIYGVIVASGAGSVDKPLDVYDIVAYAG